MFTTTHKVIIKEIFLIFSISLVCLNFVLMMEKILRLSRILSGVGTSFYDIMKIVLLIQPQLLILTVPMSFLLALLITYGRMNMDSELVVMRAVGMSMRQISFPAFIVGIVAFLMTACMTVYLSPSSSVALRMFINETIKTRAPFSLEEGIFYDTFKGITVLIGRKPSPNEMTDIFIYDATHKERPRAIIAESGKILSDNEGNPVFDIRNGYLNITHEDTFTEIAFEKYVFKINPGVDLLTERKKEMTPVRLLAEAKKQVGKKRRERYIEFHRRLTLPLINIFLIFLGPALSMSSGKTGRLSGFIYGVAVFGVYYSILVYFESLVRSGQLHHLYSWTPLVIIGSFSVVLYKREASK